MDNECHDCANIDGNIYTKSSDYSYILERYLRDKSDYRCLLPGEISAGRDAWKELGKIDLGRLLRNLKECGIDTR